MKKLDEEALLKKMSSSDTPLGTVALLQERSSIRPPHEGRRVIPARISAGILIVTEEN